MTYHFKTSWVILITDYYNIIQDSLYYNKRLQLRFWHVFKDYNINVLALEIIYLAFMILLTIVTIIWE